MKVLVAVDLQNDFITGSLGTKEAQAIIPNVVEKIAQTAFTDTLVFLTKDTHHEDYLETSEGKALPVKHCIEGTDGWKIHRDIHQTFKNDGIMRYGSASIIHNRVLKETFASVQLAKLIRDLNVDEVELCGLCTDICVVSNALLIKAICPDIKITVDATCCAGTTPEMHSRALDVMRCCQINVIGE